MQNGFSTAENQIIENEVARELRKEKKVIRVSEPQEGQVISQIFVTEKKDGSHRMILNLKALIAKV